MKFSTVIGELDIGVLVLDKIEALTSKKTVISSIYISKKHGFVIGWPTERWYLWELPQEGAELFKSQSENGGQQVRSSMPKGVKVPIVVSARKDWRGVFPSVNLTVHNLKSEKTVEDYIKEATKPMLSTGKFRVISEQSGVTPQNDIGFLTTAFVLEDGRELYQVQKFVVHKKTAFTVTAMNIVPNMPEGYRLDMSSIINSFALIGKPKGSPTMWQTIKGSLGLLKR